METEISVPTLDGHGNAAPIAGRDFQKREQLKQPGSAAPVEPLDRGGGQMSEDIAHDVLNTDAQGKLRSLIERIERLESDKAAVSTDLKEVFLEAKGDGFDTKILRKVIRLRKLDRATRQEEEALIDLYLSAIGGL
jgi:uncharacterized protein (UPF0335 family)